MRCDPSPRKSTGLSVVGALSGAVSYAWVGPKHYRPVQGGKTQHCTDKPTHSR